MRDVIMKSSRVVNGAAFVVLIGGPGVALGQMILRQPRASIQVQASTTLPEVRARLTEVGLRLQEAMLATFFRTLPQEEYVEAQRKVARGDYCDAAGNLDQVEEQLNLIFN
jgi:hypothetical protein